MPKLRRVLAWLVDFALLVALASALAVLTLRPAGRPCPCGAGSG
ncbi:hypothetical protein ACF09Y_10895 [Streptomyces massasporeus]|nr:hypothetical protein [Streptomyces sp. WAC04114]